MQLQPDEIKNENLKHYKLIIAKIRMEISDREKEIPATDVIRRREIEIQEEREKEEREDWA
ncbi:hypothetical protein HanXRQr2_Chr06g0265281 [Helianthus annuus]|uniref:Uncharacterized protein n=1 Tax=Helianthus annuus TaxID=4232 RepID=A0A9K3NJU9_HELAN|nr:hypothetical protein HanXRQr2_Chr06g0265281 [Helianthus annuus]